MENSLSEGTGEVRSEGSERSERSDTLCGERSDEEKIIRELQEKIKMAKLETQIIKDNNIMLEEYIKTLYSK